VSIIGKFPKTVLVSSVSTGEKALREPEKTQKGRGIRSNGSTEEVLH